MPVRIHVGTCSRWIKALNICLSHRTMKGPPYFRCSARSPSIPPALPDFSFFSANSISSTVNSSSMMSSQFSLDMEVKVGILRFSSATWGLEWACDVAREEKWTFQHDWISCGSDVILPFIRSLSPKESWPVGVLKRFGSFFLKSSSLFDHACLSRLARHLLAYFWVWFLRVFLFSKRGPSLGFPASHHFLQAFLHLVLSSFSSGFRMKCFLRFLGLNWGIALEAVWQICSDTALISSSSSEGTLYSLPIKGLSMSLILET